MTWPLEAFYRVNLMLRRQASYSGALYFDMDRVLFYATLADTKMQDRQN